MRPHARDVHGWSPVAAGVLIDNNKKKLAMAASSKCAALPLDARVALVTGGSRGIGREVSSHIITLGARIMVNHVSNLAKADELIAELTMRGLHVVAVKADVVASGPVC
jgi:hypothetical protein